MTGWTLKYGSDERWFAEAQKADRSDTYWNLRDPVLRRLSQAPDEFTFTLDGRAVDAASLFPYDTKITIYKNRKGDRQPNGTYLFSGGAQYFVGRRKLNEAGASGRAEAQSYRFVGPWADLEEYIYQQNWNVNASPPGGALVAQPRSHVLLNLDDTGAAQSTAWQINDAVAYVRTVAVANYGAGTEPLQLAAGTPAFAVPYDEQREITCAEVLQKELRWIPDAITWFDYTTSPPTLHVARRGSLTPVSLVLSTAQIEALDITRRDDLTRPAVVLKFEQINEINGVGWQQMTEQKAPGGATGTARGTLVATIQLAGYSLNTISATIVTKPIQANHATDATRLAWWKARLPILNNARVENLAIPVSSVSVPNIATRPYELTAGQIPPWISATADEETITARATYDVKDANGNLTKKVVDEEISVRITSTNVNTSSAPQTFSTISSFVSAEAVPAGLADNLYSALSTVQYEGRITLVESEVSQTIQLGNVLNITGGHADWTTLKALVQQVTEHLNEGRTEVLFGPAGHLGVDDLVELLRVNRWRWNYTNPAARTQGQTNATSVELGKQTPKENSTEGAEAVKHLVILDGNGATLMKIDNDAPNKKWAMTGPSGYGSVTMILTNSGTTGTGGKDLLIQEIESCEETSPGSGVYQAYKRRVLISNRYT